MSIFNFMFKKKKPKNRNYLFIVVIIVLLSTVVLAIKNIGRLNKYPAVSLGDVTIKDAHAQSYVAAASPTLQDDDKIFGSKNAPLKIFVYEDYTNAYCANLADTLDRIKAESGNQVTIIVRPYVLKNSSLSLQAAIAVDCAGDQGKWVAMRALLFAQAKNKQVAAVNFNDYARQIGLDANKFAVCLTNKQKSEKIEQLVSAAETYKVQGAPTMFIGAEMILGARPYEDFVDSNGDKIQGLKTLVMGKLE